MSRNIVTCMVCGKQVQLKPYEEGVIVYKICNSCKSDIMWIKKLRKYLQNNENETTVSKEKT